MGVRDRGTDLTAKQETFCFQTVRLGNANKAYRIAYEAGGMAQNSVNAEVSKMLQQQKIVDRIEHFRRIADAKLEVSIVRIAKELARIGFSDDSDLLDELGNAIPRHLLPEDIRRTVKSVTLVERKGLMPVISVRDKAGNLVDEFVPGADKKQRERAAKALKRQQDKGDIEMNIEFVPMREKKIELYDKTPALRIMAQWKRMVDDKTPDGADDPNDVRRLSDEELAQRIAADEAFLKAHRAVRGKSKAGQDAERKAKATQSKG